MDSAGRGIYCCCHFLCSRASASSSSHIHQSGMSSPSAPPLAPMPKSAWPRKFRATKARAESRHAWSGDISGRHDFGMEASYREEAEDYREEAEALEVVTRNAGKIRGSVAGAMLHRRRMTPVVEAKVEGTGSRGRSDKFGGKVGAAASGGRMLRSEYRLVLVPRKPQKKRGATHGDGQGRGPPLIREGESLVRA